MSNTQKTQEETWITIETRKPRSGKPLYMWDGQSIIRGFHGRSMCTKTFKYVRGFAGYNMGYDGDSAPVSGVTHWMYERLPKPPAANKANKSQ